MGSGESKTVYQSFDDVRSTFYKELEDTDKQFTDYVFNLVMNSGSFPDSSAKNDQQRLETSDAVKIKESDLTPPDNTLDIKTKDAQGNPTDPKQPHASNQYIEIYSKRTLNVTYSKNKDFKGVKDAVDEYTKELNTLFSSVAAVGGAAATENPLAILKSLFTNSDSIMGSIGGIVKTSLNLASTKTGVGIVHTQDTTLIPGGVYVANLIYTANSSIQTSSKTEVAAMAVCHTIVATSTDLINTMRNQQLISQQMVFMSKNSLDVIEKQGEILGWSEVYAKFLNLTLTTKKSKYLQVSNELKERIQALPWHSNSAPPLGGDLQDLAVYAKALDDYKNYGIFRGFSDANDLLQTLIEDAVDADDMAEYRGVVKEATETLKELKSNTYEDYNKFYKTYTDSIDRLRQLIGH